MQIDLSDKIGLPVILLENNRLDFGDIVDLDQMSSRKFSDLAVVAARENLSLSDESAYDMYRNVRKSGDEEKIAQFHQRFDLTVIPAGNLGEEYIKTSGHYHPKKIGTNVEYPELYYVASGEATYLMQKRGEKEGEITDAILARVGAGEAIVMPPNYGHVTINQTSETLVMANWVCSDFSSIYGDYEKLRGGAYYINQKSSNLSQAGREIKNKNYSEVIDLRHAKSKAQIISDLAGVPIYEYINKLESLDFLVNPENHMQDLTSDKLFQFT